MPRAAVLTAFLRPSRPPKSCWTWSASLPDDGNWPPPDDCGARFSQKRVCEQSYGRQYHPYVSEPLCVRSVRG